MLLPLDVRAMLVLHDFETTSEWSRYNWCNAQRNAGIRGRALIELLGEAFQWLVSKCLIAFDPTAGSSEAAFVTQRNREALVLGLDRLRAAERLDVDLHPAIATTIRRQFLLGEYEFVAFAAMRKVEIAVRGYAGEAHSLLGVKLMQKAFAPDGALADPEQDAGERVATMELFKGAIGVFKNPSSHRTVDYSDPTLASEAVLLANLLLRLVDQTPPARTR